MMSQKMPEWKLERFRLGELPEAEMDAIRQALDTDTELKKRLEALDASDREIETAYPASWMTRQIEQRINVEDDPETSGSSHRFGPSLALAAVMILGVVMSIWLPGPEAPPSWDAQGLEQVRLKGAQPKLFLYRKNADENEQLADQSVVRAGDLIQVFYQAGGHPYGAVVSVDGRGMVSQHWPESGNRAAKLEQGGSVSLGYAIELDDAPKWERFYFVTADETFDLDVVTNAVESGPDSLKIGNGFEQFVITLYKGAK